MNSHAFFQELDNRIAKYDLLCHPFYKAWSAGQLTRDDLREYAGAYYQHVSAFPTYLAALYSRLGDTDLRRAVLSNLCEEEGMGATKSRPHSEIWLDFAEGMGADRSAAQPSNPGVESLVDHFRTVAESGSVAEALATFYAYESQVPRVAEEKARGLQEMYGADAKTSGYFTLHTKADVYHSKVWQRQLEKVIGDDSQAADAALNAAEDAARALYQALDGIEDERLQRLAA